MVAVGATATRWCRLRKTCYVITWTLTLNRPSGGITESADGVALNLLAVVCQQDVRDDTVRIVLAEVGEANVTWARHDWPSRSIT